MNRKGRTLVIILVVVCLLAGGGYLAYRLTVKDYVDCCRMLMRVYNAEASDLNFAVSVNTSGVNIDTQFNAVRFPFQDDSAVKITVRGKSSDYTFYKIHGRQVSETSEADTGQQAIPKNFMSLLQWGAEVYQSGLDIRTTRDRNRVTYQVDVPDDLVQAFMDSYIGNIDQMEFRYSNCKLTVVSSNGVLTEISLQGTATYQVLFINASSAVSVRARVNALNGDVVIPDVPDAVVKSA